MQRPLATAFFILVASGVAAAGSNMLRAKPLEWIRGELPVPEAAAKSSGSLGASQVAASAKDPKAAGGAKLETTAPTDPGTVAIDAVLTHLQNKSAHFIDAREANEFGEGHFVGALNLPSSAVYKAEFIDPITGLVPRDDLVIVYCGGGDCEASHNVSDALRRDFGFTNVAIYTKGWAEVLSSKRFDGLLEGSSIVPLVADESSAEESRP